ncbi:MAG: PQQ-binding-like beta-propeller repeat protein [Gemmataceae bacterium]
MNRRWHGTSWLLAGMLLMLTASSSDAVIMRLTPLADVLKEGQYICVAKVEKLYPEKPALVLVAHDDLKGKLPVRRLLVNLEGDSEARKDDHSQKLIKRLAPELPVILFANQRGQRLTVFAYTNGTWFQMVGTRTDDPERITLAFTHCEPYLRRTYQGTTMELRQVIVDGLAGKKAPPPPNPKEPPGLGPEVPASKDSKPEPNGALRKPTSFFDARFANHSRYVGSRPLFGVIPTLGVGAPLAVLALLFPSLFGGVFVLFRRWLAFFTVISVNGTLLFGYLWFGYVLGNSWWGTLSAVWLVCSLITLLGIMWTWRRHLTISDAVPSGERAEHIVLWLLSLSCGLALMGYSYLRAPALTDLMYSFLWVFSAGVWSATLYQLYRWLLARRFFAATVPLPTEGVVLLTALGGFIIVGTFLTSSLPAVSSDLASQHANQPIARLLTEKEWNRTFIDQGSGLIVSSPLVVEGRIYLAVAHRQSLQTFGALYCLDATTRDILWTFDDNQEMKQVISSPYYVAGRLFVGEGFHDDVDCKLYCLKADDGTLIWKHPTTGQTESSPCVADGKVFVGVGNAGIVALDIQTGKQLWQFPRQSDERNYLRVCADPVVVGKRLYVGSGVDRNRPEHPGTTALFCLDTDTGEAIWQVEVDLPFWGKPVVRDDRVYFGIGNGDVLKDVDPPARPAGALLCLAAADGRHLWRVDVPNGVLRAPAVDSEHVYFGSRDGYCYCVDRFSGSRRWQKNLGSPVVAGVVLDQDADTGQTLSVFVVSSQGRISCLDAKTGQSHWSHHKLELPGTHISATPTLVVRHTPQGRRRQLYVGAALNNLAVPVLYALEDFLPQSPETDLPIQMARTPDQIGSD